jgi:hypothetical protein
VLNDRLSPKLKLASRNHKGLKAKPIPDNMPLNTTAFSERLLLIRQTDNNSAQRAKKSCLKRFGFGKTSAYCKISILQHFD